jgi:hypothetical protein
MGQAKLRGTFEERKQWAIMAGRIKKINYWEEKGFKPLQLQYKDIFSDIRGAKFLPTKIKNPSRITFTKYLRKYFQDKHIGRIH